MAIKTTVQGSIPAVDLDHVQFNQFNMSVSMNPPYKISVTGKLRMYGVDVDGNNIYDKNDLPPLSIPDIHALIASLEPADQLIASTAMQKVQEGLGILAEYGLGIPFVSYEA